MYYLAFVQTVMSTTRFVRQLKIWAFCLWFGAILIIYRVSGPRSPW